MKKLQIDQLVLAVSGVLIFIGAQLHPRAPVNLEFRDVEQQTLSDPHWRGIHLILLAGIVIFLLGLYLMRRTGRFAGDSVLTAAVYLTMVGGVILVGEMIVHILMNSEADAVGAGGPALLFDVHVVLQAIGTPLFGIGVALIAAVGGLRAVWGGRLLGLLGVIGALAFGLSGPMVALYPRGWDMLLFIGLVPMTVWLVLTCAWTMWRERQRPTPAGAAAA